MALEYRHDERVAYQQQVMADREQRALLMAEYTRKGGCPHCNREGGLFFDDAENVLWYLQQEPDQWYGKFPYYRQSSHDTRLMTPCTRCHPAGLGAEDGWQRLSWKQAWLHAMRQRRLERRDASGQ